ncbi:hypothetical protein ACFB49_25290 [Sphingomonas sp. DBB INV C78]|uniref:M56 family metallopeptidase n=1 Tax=Sphingomonas sp. DBB INV C78 TaxID=3349434 RepID=UPI0036D21DBA
MSAAWIAENLVASALLMGVVLLVRGRVATAFGARVAYMLWALPVLRLVMPPLPEAAQPVVAHVPIRIDLSGLEQAAAAFPASGGGSEALASSGPDWFAIALAVWLGGAALHFGWQIGIYRHFLKMALRGSAFLCRRCGIAVHMSAGVDGPVAAGILRRHILLPGDFRQRYTRQEQRLVLAHEVAHHVRGDLIANIAALALLSLHWFNPLAHIAYRAFRADQELACDETVLAAEPAGEHHAYATALVKSAVGATPAAACALGAARIKRRLRMMATIKTGRVRRMAGSALAGALVGAGLVLTASGGIAAKTGLEIPRLAAVDPVTAPAPVPAVKPVPVVASVVAPDASSIAEPADAPVPPMAPVAPTPVVASDPETVAQNAELARERAAEARERAAEARAEARERAAEAREIEREARQAQREAMREVADMDIEGQVRAAMAEARADLERECGNRPGAKRVSASMDHGQAMAVLASNCVDVRAIRAEVADALREARDDIRRSDLTSDQRRRATAALDAEIAKLRRDGYTD